MMWSKDDAVNSYLHNVRDATVLSQVIPVLELMIDSVRIFVQTASAHSNVC